MSVDSNENILPIPLVPHHLRVCLYVEELKRPSDP